MKRLTTSLALVLFAATLRAEDPIHKQPLFVEDNEAAVKEHKNDADFIGTKKGILTCTLGPTCRVMHMPLLLQTDPNLDADVKDMGGTGCLLTSVATVILTALANRAPGLTPTGRTKTFMDIPTGNATKRIEQLSQEYRWEKEGQPLYVPEVAADFGDIVEDCNPFKLLNCPSASNAVAHAFRIVAENDEITNEFIRGLMERNYVVLIAYKRFNPVAAPGGRIGLVEDEKKHKHKVVFSGFGVGKYPLRINNVGSAKRVRGRLSTDLTQRTFSMNAHPTADSFDFPLETRTYLELDGEGLKTDEPVHFIETISALKIVTSDDLATMKQARPALNAKGCGSFLGRLGDYLCTSDNGLAACEKARKEGKAMVCRRAGKK